MVGRINSQKNQMEIIDFFNSSKFKTLNIEYQLHIMGGGEDKYIRKISENKISESIKFFGFLDKPYLFKEIDFLIINSVNEAFGRVVAEANFYGIPVLARASGALPEIIIEGRNGFLFENLEQFEELLIKICRYFSLEDYKVISKLSRDHFTENFSFEYSTEQTYKLFNKHIQIKNSNN